MSLKITLSAITLTAISATAFGAVPNNTINYDTIEKVQMKRRGSSNSSDPQKAAEADLPIEDSPTPTATPSQKPTPTPTPTAKKATPVEVKPIKLPPVKMADQKKNSDFIPMDAVGSKPKPAKKARHGTTTKKAAHNTTSRAAVRTSPAPAAPMSAPAPTPARASSTKSSDGAIDLGSANLDNNPAPSGGTADSGAAGLPVNPHTFSGIAPNLKIYFDFALASQPGVSDGSGFSFNNYHAFLFVESTPTDKAMFSFDLGPSGLHYYELDYLFTPKLTVRVGKIWVPFDDLGPHALFGGRINNSRLLIPGQQPFLPDIWTEMGVGIRYKFLDTAKLAFTGDLYVTNGFKSTTDPNFPGQIAPNFAGVEGAGSGVSDNNRDKAIGIRGQATFMRKLSIGASFYSARYSDDSQPYERLQILGLDSQFRMSATGTELRAGLALMVMGTNGGSGHFSRGGWYLEAGQKLGKKGDWKGLLRGGAISADSRVVSVSDQSLIGGMLLYKPSNIQLSFEYSQDVKRMIAKVNRSYAAFRIVMEF